MPENKNQPKNNELRDDEDMENEESQQVDRGEGMDEEEEGQDKVSRGGRLDEEEQVKPDKGDDEEIDLDDEPTGRQPRIDE